jgi:DNA-binding phage protein
MPRKTAHEAAVDALLTEAERPEYARRVQALRSRNALLTMLETAREAQGMTKRALASRAGLDASSVRRLLTSAAANPTTDNAFRLMAAMGILLEATLPTGERVQLVSPETPAPAAGSSVGAPRLDAAA